MIRKSKSLGVALAAGLLSLACNTTDFNRTDKVEKPIPPPVPEDHVLTSMGMDEKISGGLKTIQTIDKVDMVFQAADTRVLDEDVTTTKQGLDLMFVLDTTVSMVDEMDAVKNGINQIADSLKSSGIDFKVGMVGFVDSFAATRARTFKLSSDVAAFRSFITRIQPEGNEDFPESSLFAAREAVKMLGDAATARPDAMKVIVLIADVVGHNGSTLAGGKPTRDCSTAGLVSEINAFATGLPGGQDNFRFFYTVPDPSVLVNNTENAGAFKNCAGNDDPAGFTAKKQMEEIWDRILPNVERARRGGALVDANGRILWPLTQTNLVSTLAPLLRTNTARADISGSCLATKAQLYEGNRVIHDWSPAQLADVNASFASGNNEIRLPDVLKDSRTERARRLDLRVDRCCVTAADIAAGNFSVCRRTYTQVINYEITVTKPRTPPGQ